MADTCDRPIRDRSGEELPGVTCNLDKHHLGRCVKICFDGRRVRSEYGPTEYGKLSQAGRLLRAQRPTSRR